MGTKVSNPPDGFVDLDNVTPLTYGATSGGPTITMTESNLGSKFPGATTVYLQVVARDGDWFMMSNILELQP